MSTTTPEQKEEIFATMKEFFSDIPYFSEYVADKLKQAINECDNIVLSYANVKNFARRFYETGRYETEDEKKKWKEIQWIFATLCVLIVSYQERATSLFWHRVEELVNAYPMFAKLADVDELKLLLRFRNMLVAATLVLNPRLNKELIIYVAGRLEGTQRRYITGKGQRDAVTMRVRIYEKEGDVVPEVRPYRAQSEKVPAVKRTPGSPDGRPKKKRLEVPIKPLSYTSMNMGAIRPLQGPSKVPATSKVSGQKSSTLQSVYQLSSGESVGLVGSRLPNTLAFGAASDMFTEGNVLSDLTTDSQADERDRTLFLGRSQPFLKPEGGRGGEASFELLSQIMLASAAHDTEGSGVESDLYTMGSSNVPFPSLKAMLPPLSSLPVPAMPSSFHASSDLFRPSFPKKESTAKSSASKPASTWTLSADMFTSTPAPGGSGGSAATNTSAASSRFAFRQPASVVTASTSSSGASGSSSGSSGGHTTSEESNTSEFSGHTGYGGRAVSTGRDSGAEMLAMLSLVAAAALNNPEPPDKGGQR